MRIIWSIMIIVASLHAATIEHIRVGEHDYTIMIEPYNLYESRGISMKLYLEEESEDLHYLITHLLEDKTGGCLGKSIQKGTYKIIDNRLTLYTKYSRSGREKDAPIGVEVAYFKFREDGSLQKLASQIHLKISQKEGDNIKALEKAYGATFVFGVAAKKLQDEVTTALKELHRHAIWR